MGKTKQEKKFDRNVEISAPILDPEIIKQIHSPPKDQKRDIRHGGFKALLSDLNSQDSTDELTPINEPHLPSYIGISCAVSGYSNYSSYGRKPLNEPSTRLETKTYKLATTNSKQTPNRSQTNSPLAVRSEQHNIHHVTIDKSNINSVDQERKELTEKLTASAAERRQSPSPIPPTEDDRHHGAYVGARYFPMPEPSKLVNKHIPLLGIDDDVDPEVVVEDVNKVEQKIASLYGDDFVEDWKESMSHKSKKEAHDEKQPEKTTSINLKEIVNLRPTPPKAPRPDETIQVDVPMPNVKVLANVEKQFLNKLLTDEHPPMPKSPSPQSSSPVSPKFSSSTKTYVTTQQETVSNNRDSFQTSSSPQHQKQQNPITPVLDHETQEPVAVTQDELVSIEQVGDKSSSNAAVLFESSQQPNNDFNQTDSTTNAGPAPLISLEASPTLTDTIHKEDQSTHLKLIEEENVLDAQQQLLAEQSDEIGISPGQHQELNAIFDTTAEIESVLNDEVYAAVSNGSHRSRSSSTGSHDQAKSPESQISSSTVERVPLDKQQQYESEYNEDHIEYEIQEHSPHLDNKSSPVRILEKPDDDGSLSVAAKGEVIQETDNLVSFSPEPIDELRPETNNNFEGQLKLDESVSPEDDAVCGDQAREEEAVEVITEAGSPVSVHQVGESSDSVKDGHYFLDLLKEEESFILERVRLAEKLLAEHENEMDEERLGRIHSAIGKANLLVNKKCNQFRDLCKKSISGDANDQYAVLNDDLAGFWDMISIQITDVRKSLENP